MFVLFSHLMAFSALFVAGISDLYTTDVPDVFGIAGVVGGLLLHAGAAYTTGSLEPLLWSIGMGLAFSMYGWGAYVFGMWGGADAFAMSVLGFAAPYSLSGPGLLHGFNLFVNVMLLGFVYSLGYAAYKAFRYGGVFRHTLIRVRQAERRIALEVFTAGLFAAILQYAGVNAVFYFAAMVALVFLYRFFQVLQDEAMSHEVALSELEPGAVVDLESIDIEIPRDKSGIGRKVETLRKKAEGSIFDALTPFLSGFEEKVGYPMVVGVTEDELEQLESEGVEQVQIVTGARFVPVFAVALLVTDVFGGGMFLLMALF